jgi:hypothetical protein
MYNNYKKLLNILTSHTRSNNFPHIIYSINLFNIKLVNCLINNFFKENSNKLIKDLFLNII